jgi:hypothetical protein
MSEKQETHTPGPWTTSRSTHGTWIGHWIKKVGWAGHVASLPDHMEQDGVQCGSIAGQDKTQGEIDANARLIASAPELLEQCKLFEKLLTVMIMEGDSGADLERDNLRAVLAKVEGESA